jgi:putative membrane protein
MMFFMMLFWAVLIGAAVWFIYRLAIQKGPRAGQSPDQPEEIVKARYARGEIDADAYHRMMDELKRSA